MRFLWFGKKKVKPTPVLEVEKEREPEEVYSVVGFTCETNPIATAKNTQLHLEVINSLILSVLSQANSPADLAAQEFFQAHGANVLPTDGFTYSAERGYSSRVRDEKTLRTVLIGPAPVIARAATPFCRAISTAIAENPNALVVAVDGIAYASYSITKELV
jgi:hypothetical protein